MEKKERERDWENKRRDWSARDSRERVANLWWSFGVALHSAFFYFYSSFSLLSSLYLKLFRGCLAAVLPSARREPSSSFLYLLTSSRIYQVSFRLKDTSKHADFAFYEQLSTIMKLRVYRRRTDMTTSENYFFRIIIRNSKHFEILENAYFKFVLNWHGRSYRQSFLE